MSVCTAKHTQTCTHASAHTVAHKGQIADQQRSVVQVWVCVQSGEKKGVDLILVLLRFFLRGWTTFLGCRAFRVFPNKSFRIFCLTTVYFLGPFWYFCNSFLHMREKDANKAFQIICVSTWELLAPSSPDLWYFHNIKKKKSTVVTFWSSLQFAVSVEFVWWRLLTGADVFPTVVCWALCHHCTQC